jgi:hypothetical protein
MIVRGRKVWWWFSAYLFVRFKVCVTVHRWIEGGGFIESVQTNTATLLYYNLI